MNILALKFALTSTFKTNLAQGLRDNLVFKTNKNQVNLM